MNNSLSGKYFVILLSLLTVNILSVSNVCAQDNDHISIPIDLGIGFFHGLGYKIPSVDFGTGIETSGRRFQTQNMFFFSPTDKTAYKTTLYYFQSRVFLVLSKKIVAGGGLKYSHLKFDESGDLKNPAHPLLLVGFRKGHKQLVFQYIFSGTDRFNHVSGIRFEYWSLAGPMRLEVGITGYVYDIETLRPKAGRIITVASDIHFKYLF